MQLCFSECPTKHGTPGGLQKHRNARSREQIGMLRLWAERDVLAVRSPHVKRPDVHRALNPPCQEMQSPVCAPAEADAVVDGSYLQRVQALQLPEAVQHAFKGACSLGPAERPRLAELPTVGWVDRVAFDQEQLSEVWQVSELGRQYCALLKGKVSKSLSVWTTCTKGA